ncbi:MAG: hypothetical protein U1E20_00770 [Methylocystis sp.]|uniref:tetratricopeptide repeat protein n=1 Tax=Methylocystis sp. TaxID=1911079 RepID=UPI00392A0F6F
MRDNYKIMLYLCTAICLLGSAQKCRGVEYTLGPMSLRKPLSNDLLARYACFSRTEFANAIQCNLKSFPQVTARTSMAETLIVSSDGQILYAHRKTLQSGTLDQISNNIASDISDVLAGMTPRRFSAEDVTVAIWGDVKLEEISSGTEEYRELKGLVEQNYGLLVGTAGDLKATKDHYKPVYRVIGGDGLVVIVSQNDQRQVLVQRLIVAAGTLAERNFNSQIRQFFLRDRASLANDFSKWPEVAFMIRRLALNTTPENANRIVDETFSAASSKKYYSHVWAFLPTSVIKHLSIGTYRAADIFGEKTEFPEIRDRIITELKLNPKEPFSEFLLYTLGRFGDGVKFNSKSPIHTTLVYARAHYNLRKVMSGVFERIRKPDDKLLVSDKIIDYSYRDNSEKERTYFYGPETVDEKNRKLAKKDFFSGHAFEYMPDSNNDYKDSDPSLTQFLNFFNQFPERYDSRPISFKVADFVALTDTLSLQLEEVLKDQKSPHFDDAAYLLGWLAYHRGNIAVALDFFGSAVALIPKNSALVDSYNEHLDYAPMALHELIRILRTVPPEDAINRVRNSEVLSSQSQVWYEVLASFYHSHQYHSVMAGAQLALDNFGISIENMPVTTDPERIAAIFTNLGLAGDRGLQEIVYLYHSSREIAQVEKILSDLDNHSPSSIATKLKEVIIKYSLTRDSDLEKKPFDRKPHPLHKDLRQSLFVVQQSLDLLPKTPIFSKLREWLHYERIRLLAQFDPIKVDAANAEFENEFPQSSLLDDGLAEQIFAEGVIVGDMDKAAETFDRLRRRYPGANAIDNAYSWMAIGWTCAGQPTRAREIDQEVVRLFPLTRHARYAGERMENPAACKNLEELYLWDYWAMRWRERNRINTIQDSLSASGIRSTPLKLR